MIITIVDIHTRTELAARLNCNIKVLVYVQLICPLHPNVAKQTGETTYLNLCWRMAHFFISILFCYNNKLGYYWLFYGLSSVLSLMPLLPIHSLPTWFHFLSSIAIDEKLLDRRSLWAEHISITQAAPLCWVATKHVVRCTVVFREVPCLAWYAAFSGDTGSLIHWRFVAGSITPARRLGLASRKHTDRMFVPSERGVPYSDNVAHLLAWDAGATAAALQNAQNDLAIPVMVTFVGLQWIES